MKLVRYKYIKKKGKVKNNFMRIAVISDIHGNYFAFDTVLADIQRRGIEQIVCLGDAIQGGAQPAETVERLRQLNCPVVMGNADAWLFTPKDPSDPEEVSEQQITVRAWTVAQLSDEQKEYIQQFKPTIEIALEAGKKLLCFHGSPHSFYDIILPNTAEETFQQFLSGFAATLLTGGHTHTQQWRRLGESSWYFNPGSVGFAYDWRSIREPGSLADSWANYAIVTSEGERVSVEFCHVPYDSEKLIEIIRASGRPYPEESIKWYQKQ